MIRRADQPVILFAHVVKLRKSCVIPAGNAGIHDCMDAGGRATQEQLPSSHGWQLQIQLTVFSYMKSLFDLLLMPDGMTAKWLA